MSEDVMGDRMKEYESVESSRRFMPLLPIIVRLDGIGFSKFTKGLKRPYDERMSNMMMMTTRYLMEISGAKCGYTQSDEITLGIFSSDYRSQVFHDGRIQKIISVLAGRCSVYFNKLLPQYIPEKAEESPAFDCRAWQMPNIEEGANAFLWREFDAYKNSVSMSARELFSHKELQNKNCSQMIDMMYEKNVQWNQYPEFFKRGTYFQRVYNSELDPKTNEVKYRSEIIKVVIPPLVKVTNRAKFLWFGQPPEINNQR